MQWEFGIYGEEEEELAAKSEDPTMKKIWNDKIAAVDINVHKVFQGTHALINWVNAYIFQVVLGIEQANVFYLFQVTGIEAIALSEFVTPLGDPLINIVDEPIFPAKPHTWLFHKFNPWQPRFNEFIQKCLEAGLIKHYKDLTLSKARSDFLQSDKEKNIVVERPSISSMTFQDLQVFLNTFHLFNQGIKMLSFSRASSISMD